MRKGSMSFHSDRQWRILSNRTVPNWFSDFCRTKFYLCSPFCRLSKSGSSGMIYRAVEEESFPIGEESSTIQYLLAGVDPSVPSLQQRNISPPESPSQGAAIASSPCAAKSDTTRIWSLPLRPSWNRAGCDRPPDTAPHHRTCQRAFVDPLCGAHTHHTCTLTCPGSVRANVRRIQLPTARTGRCVRLYFCFIIPSILSGVGGHCALLLLLPAFCYITSVRYGDPARTGWSLPHGWQ